MLNRTKSDAHEKRENMYHDVGTWSPFAGCKFGCVYCKPSYQRMLRRVYFCQGKKCAGCRDFTPHEHADRLTKPLPAKPTIWACAHGDITFADPDFIKRIIERTKDYPEKEFYWQTKDPECYEKYLPYFPPNTTLLITLETNRNEEYRKYPRLHCPPSGTRPFQR